MRFKDYYKLLGVNERASQDEIKKSFRNLAKKNHPDANPGNKQAEERFKEITEAYDVIGDTEKRNKYDQLRFYGNSDSSNGDWVSFDPDFLQKHGMPRKGGGREDFSQLFNQGQGFAFSDLLRDIFGTNGFSSGFEQTQAAVPQDITGSIKVSFLEAIKGTDRIIAIRQKKKCSVCGGLGQDSYSPCMRCNGSGQISSKKKVRIRIPSGVNDGHQLRLRGLGPEVQFGSGQKSDVLITVQIAPHSFFTRSKADIYCEARVDELSLTHGIHIHVPTVDGKKIELNIPAGTKKGTVFRLKNYGIKMSSQKGDQFVKII